MTDHAEVPESILRRVRVACAHLPEAYEEQAYTGFRWRIRGRTLAHLVTIVDPRGARTVVVFHAPPDELDALIATGHPFFPGWGGGLVTMVLRDDGTTDWGDVEELLTESYCLLAPKKLVRLLDSFRPVPTDPGSLAD